MKKYIILFYFAFHVTSYAQSVSIINENFESKVIFENYNYNQFEVIKTNKPITFFDYDYDSYTDVDKRCNYIVNRLYFLRSQLKKINVSQNIDSDYWIFTQKQMVSLYVIKKTANLRYPSNCLKDFNKYENAI